VQSLEVRRPEDLKGAFEVVRRQRPDALVTAEDPLTLDHRNLVADFAAGQRLPSLHGPKEFAAAGGPRLLTFQDSPDINPALPLNVRVIRAIAPKLSGAEPKRF